MSPGAAFLSGSDAGVPAPASPLARMDALVKFCAVLCTVVGISTFPADAGWRYPAVLGLLAALWALARLPGRYLLRRFLAATPFIAMAAALPVASALPAGSQLAIAIAWKAYSAILLLSMLAATTPVEEIVESMRRLGAPRGLALVATLMHRYLFVLLEEWRRMGRARECRTGGRVARGRMRIWSNQAAMVFVRGWERADRVAHAMLARGFRGEFPALRRTKPRARDLAFGLALPVAVLTLRLV